MPPVLRLREVSMRKKGVEDPLQQLRRNARAVVFDAQPEPRRAVVHHQPRALAVEHHVVDQVANAAPQPRGVTRQRGQGLAAQAEFAAHGLLVGLQAFQQGHHVHRQGLGRAVQATQRGQRVADHGLHLGQVFLERCAGRVVEQFGAQTQSG